LVAFGYLSMLLCTVCLEKPAREYARGKLPGGSLTQLKGAAQMFVAHLQTVEALSADSESTKAFTTHFGTVLLAMESDE